MEELSQQLRAEIEALREHIARLEDHFLATTWTAELLAPLQRLDTRLEETDLRAIVVVRKQVRDQFAVIGKLGPQISQLLTRYFRFLAQPPDTGAAPPEPALDPAPGGVPGEEEERSKEPVQVRPAAASAPPVTRPAREVSAESEDLSGLSMDVFTHRPKAAPTPRSPSASPLILYPLGGKRRGQSQQKIKSVPRQDLVLAYKFRPADLKKGMQLSLPAQEQVQFDFKLQKKTSSRLVDSLREQAEAQSLLLIPRVTQFQHQDTLCPCTAKALISLFRNLLGNLQDWAQYRGCPFMDEAPEPGWALVAPESLPQTVCRNYLDQQQALRQHAEALGVFPRPVRRRSLVEALYDLIAAHLVPGLRLNHQTLDATPPGPTGNDFVRIYFSGEDIRVRNLPHATSHPALGVCPSL